MEEEYVALQTSLDVIKGKKLKYKELCPSTEDYERAKATILANMKRLASKFMQT